MEFIKKRWRAFLMAIFLLLGFVFYIVAQTVGYLDGSSDSWIVMSAWIIVDIIFFGGAILGAFLPKFEKTGQVCVLVLVIGNAFLSGVSLWGQFLRINELGDNSLPAMNSIYVITGLIALIIDIAMVTGIISFLTKGPMSKKLIQVSSLLFILVGLLALVASFINFGAKDSSVFYEAECGFYSYRDLYWGLMFIGFGFGLMHFYGQLSMPQKE